MKRAWIAGGWGFALFASAMPPLWYLAGKLQRNPLGRYVDAQTGLPTLHALWQFLGWWLPIAVPVSLLALACMYLNRPS